MKSKYVALALIVLVFIATAYNFVQKTSNEDAVLPDTSMTLTLAAPRADDTYYADSYSDIVEFQIGYAQKIIEAGNDSVQILADRETIDMYGDRLPNGVFVENPMLDIWMRDFTLINPSSPVQFRYTDASMSAAEAAATQAEFNSYLSQTNISYQSTDLLIDGGNIVDDYSGRAITTTRFLEDNNLSMELGKSELRELLGVDEVAILEPDDEALAHSDGMVAWIDNGVLAVNDYSTTDPEFHEVVMNELRAAFSDVRFVMIPVEFDDEGSGADPAIGSACGININLVYTPTTLYVPTFGRSHEAEALQQIRENTSKQVVEIPANGVCRYGGSARCTVWQSL